MCTSFLISRMRIIMIPTLVFYEDKFVARFKVLRTVPGVVRMVHI